MRSRVPTLTLTLALLLLASVTGGGDPALAAGFRVENADLDLGRVKAGEIASATFVFRNDGPSDVRILKAAPS
jgi:hypothetical protein